ncbi:hypothetical protein CJ030_MR0G013389 [Morella rubra]|uniref:Uncharacterized protein n=1 Tax=Morella rubra TaxID=262757 RepID=A0A6A1UHS9_9ROSI|nr:hypothetical protein CJ030_MR0G013389 [Morella rubra]
MTLSDFDDLLYEDHSSNSSSTRDFYINSHERRSKGQKGALTQRFAPRVAIATDMTARLSIDAGSSRSEAPLKTRASAVPLPWVAQLFKDLDSRVSAAVKTTLRPLKEHVEKLEREMQWLRDCYNGDGNAFDGECTVTMLRNKSIVAHMTLVEE